MKRRRKKRGVVVTLVRHLWRVLQAPFQRSKKKSQIAERLLLVEYLIGKHSSVKAKAGSHKGHATTNTAAWITELAEFVIAENAARNKWITYDGNMATAARLGLILVAWYSNVHRAKSYDPHRPLSARCAAAVQRTQFLAELSAVLADDSVMGEVWGNSQQWNYPFGKGAKGGKFV